MCNGGVFKYGVFHTIRIDVLDILAHILAYWHIDRCQEQPDT